MRTGFRNILDLLLAQGLVAEARLAFEVIKSSSRDQHSTGFTKFLEAGGNIDAIAIDVVSLCDHVTKIDSDPNDDASILWRIGITFSQGALRRLVTNDSSTSPS